MQIEFLLRALFAFNILAPLWCNSNVALKVSAFDSSLSIQKITVLQAIGEIKERFHSMKFGREDTKVVYMVDGIRRVILSDKR